MSVLHVLVYHDAVVEHILQQFLHQVVVVAHFRNAITYGLCLKVVGINACPYRVVHSLIVVETV